MSYSIRSLSSPSQWVPLLLSFVTFFCGCSPAVAAATRGLASRLVDLDSSSDVMIQSAYMLATYVIQYAVLGGVFEGTHPDGIASSTLSKDNLKIRRNQVWSEITTGLFSLFVTVLIAICWMAYVEHHLPFYGYFESVQWNVGWGALGLAAYVFAFDTWFYWTHWVLHRSEYLWNNVHTLHHAFKEPSAFAQFAVHPLEALIQGPLGHFAVQLICPVHPIQLALLGFLSSAWAFAAHDGRWGDFNSHYFHHSKGRGRMNYFNLGFLTPAWDVIMDTRWSETHPLWVEWTSKKGKTLFDTVDGTAEGRKNDTYGSYEKDSVHAKKF